MELFREFDALEGYRILNTVQPKYLKSTFPYDGETVRGIEVLLKANQRAQERRAARDQPHQRRAGGAEAAPAARDQTPATITLYGL